MANNFKNAVIRNVSADITLPTVIYSVPDSKKSIAIELDVANKGSAGVNVMGDAGSGSYTNGMKTTTMIMPIQVKGEVGSSSTTWVSPLYNSTIGKLNNRLVLLYK